MTPWHPCRRSTRPRSRELSSVYMRQARRCGTAAQHMYTVRTENELKNSIKKRDPNISENSGRLTSSEPQPAHAIDGGSHWIRDLHEEGIEPHPGPHRILFKNVNGLQSSNKLHKFLLAVRAEHRDGSIAATLVAEHNLARDQQLHHQKAANHHRVLLIVSYQPKALVGRPRGGTLIAIPHSAIELRDGEDLHTAIDRIRSSVRTSPCGRTVSANIYIQNAQYRLVAAYAPVGPPALRVRYFTKTLPKFITKRSVLAIDANCVPDVELDVKRSTPATAPYENRGATELADLVARYDLSDIAREQMGRDPSLFTAHHNTSGGTCHSRIDQIYTPNVTAAEWNHSTVHSFHPAPGPELDHVAIQVSLVTPTAKRGADLRFINERIFDDHTFNKQVLIAINTSFGLAPYSPPDPAAAWERTKATVRKLCFKQTRRIKIEESAQSQLLKLERMQLQSELDRGEAAQATLDRLQELKSEIPQERRLARSLAESVPLSNGASRERR